MFSYFKSVVIFENWRIVVKFAPENDRRRQEYVFLF